MPYQKTDISQWPVGGKFVVKVTRDWKVDAEVEGCSDYSISNITEFKSVAWGHDVRWVWYEFERLEAGFKSTLRKFKLTEALQEI